jgi:protein subunit release factor A
VKPLKDRVTDHRLGKRHFSWTDMMEGNGLELILEDLKAKHNAELLEERLDFPSTTAT